MSVPSAYLGYDEDIALFGSGDVMRAVTADVAERRGARPHSPLDAPDSQDARDVRGVGRRKKR
ncbi:hypothetical protein KIH74_33735 [Kineosporia sp. J2-2]|uniref:Uncharacterized protein n=1 Tax=Kineosporia corallincola TaxID=2835133 RepID=A0ABS5TT41_9ACTN|nr:hypothetical protein [Kineosporia corallincola]MBT0773955.1 hypothetical protein [Kineosporia corallincola]